MNFIFFRAVSVVANLQPEFNRFFPLVSFGNNEVAAPGSLELARIS